MSYKNNLQIYLVKCAAGGFGTPYAGGNQSDLQAANRRLEQEAHRARSLSKISDAIASLDPSKLGGWMLPYGRAYNVFDANGQINDYAVQRLLDSRNSSDYFNSSGGNIGGDPYAYTLRKATEDFDGWQGRDVYEALKKGFLARRQAMQRGLKDFNSAVNDSIADIKSPSAYSDPTPDSDDLSNIDFDPTSLNLSANDIEIPTIDFTPSITSAPAPEPVATSAPASAPVNSPTSAQAATPTPTVMPSPKPAPAVTPARAATPTVAPYSKPAVASPILPSSALTAAGGANVSFQTPTVNIPEFNPAPNPAPKPAPAAQATQNPFYDPKSITRAQMRQYRRYTGANNMNSDMDRWKTYQAMNGNRNASNADYYTAKKNNSLGAVKNPITQPK